MTNPSLFATPARLGDEPPRVRHRRHGEVSAVADRLMAEFADSHPRDVVRRTVTHCQESLLRAGVRAGIAPATEAMARLKLLQRLPAHADPAAHRLGDPRPARRAG
jgi:hypothetical protein